jgi:curli production assembly/transport component CsgG
MHKFILASALGATLLSGCATITSPAPRADLIAPTKTTSTLVELPAPAKPLDVAVYDFPDLTGQAKPNPAFAEYSRAVTQGGGAMLVDVLTTAGGGSWFRVVERSGLKNLVQERTLIENTRKAYGGGGGLPPVRFAGIILEGGIVGYDSDFVTGGAGAKYFGIGGDVQYRADLVTINLRAVSVESGEVLASVTTSKQVYSYQNRASTYTFTSPLRLLQIDAGVSHNDPGQLAVREALELGVYTLVVNGLKSNLWHLKDRSLEPALIASFETNYVETDAPRKVASK